MLAPYGVIRNPLKNRANFAKIFVALKALDVFDQRAVGQRLLEHLMDADARGAAAQGIAGIARYEDNRHVDTLRREPIENFDPSICGIL